MYLKSWNAKAERRRMTILLVGIFLDISATYLLYWGAALVLKAILPADNLTYEFYLWLGSLIQYGIGFPLAYFVMGTIPADPMEEREISAGQMAKYFLIISFLLTAGMLLGNQINNLIGKMMGQLPADPTSAILNPQTWIWTVLTSVFLAPVTEELIFRKRLLDRTNRLGDTTSILLSGILFGLMHGNFYQFFYALFVGMFLAYIYLNTGRIRYTILLHMMVNFLYGLVPAFLADMEDNLLYYILTGAYNALQLALILAGLVLLVPELMKARFLKGWLDTTGRKIAAVTIWNPGMLLLLGACFYQFVQNLRY